MRLVSLTVPTALLLSLCISCNSNAYREEYKNKRATFDLSSSTADSSAISANTGTGLSQADYEKEDRQQVAGQPKKEAWAGPSPHTGNPVAGAPQENPDWDKKIVKTADLKLEVKSFRSFTDQLHQLVKRNGGYIAQEQQSQSVYTIENTVTIRVPVDRFDEVMMQLASDSDRMVERKIGSEDVTMQIVDTKSRLEAKKEVRERYLDLLKQARNMKDILAVQNEINDIQEQMEQASGRIAYLGHSAAFSTINLNFYQVLNAGAPEDPSPSFFYKIKEAIGRGWEWSSSLVLGLISLWPLWIAIGLGVIGIRKWRAGSTIKPSTPLP